MLIIRFREQVNKILEALSAQYIGECQDTPERGRNTVQRKDVELNVKQNAFLPHSHMCPMLPS